MRRWCQFNSGPRSKSNVKYHYDLSGALYDLLLGKDKQYSCGYFNDVSDTLEEARIAPRSAISSLNYI